MEAVRVGVLSVARAHARCLARQQHKVTAEATDPQAGTGREGGGTLGGGGRASLPPPLQGGAVQALTERTERR